MIMCTFKAPTFVKEKSLFFALFHLNFKLICFFTSFSCYRRLFFLSKANKQRQQTNTVFFIHKNFYFMLIGTFFPFIFTCFVYKYLQSQTQILHFYTVWCYCLPFFFVCTSTFNVYNVSDIMHLRSGIYVE